MDELVTDLTLALERTDDPQSSNSDTTKDSPSSTPIRKPIKKRRGRKRRSDFPLTKDFAMLSEESNDSVEEALKDYIENITMYQSDSDDDGVLASCKRLSMYHRLKMDPYPLPERQEGDQLNNSVIGLSKRRGKRNKKMKRAAQQSSLGALQNSQEFSLNGSKTTKGTHSRRSLKRKLSNRLCGNACGETWTRRSKYEEGALHENDSGGRSSDLMSADMVASRYPRHFNFSALSSEDRPGGGGNGASWDQNAPQDDVMAGSDTDTSSGNESEGFFTNDEGRLGDDEGEESTFEQDPCANIIPWWEDDNQCIDGEEKFQHIVEGVMNEYGIQAEASKRGGGYQLISQLPEEVYLLLKKNSYPGFQARLNSLKSMYETNNKFLLDTKRKINKFLHDSSKIELSIPLHNRNEREQIHHLASLYALHCRSENSAHHGHVILLKTRNTCKPDKDALNSLLGRDGKRKGLQMSEVKRARRMATEGSVGQFASAIPENNIGNQMLRSMGWVPGTGLGPDKKGIVNPISAKLRPRKLGLGHAWPT